jgi:chromosome segregation ATPase
MDQKELQNRQQFVTDTRAVVEEIKRDVNGETMKAKMQSNQRQALLGASGHQGPKKAQNRYAKMENELKQGNQGFIDDQIQRQQQIMREQDQDLGKVSHSLHVLGQMGEEIGNELDDQNRMLDDLSHHMEHTDSRLTSLINRVDKISKKAGDKCQIATIVVLVIILVIVIVLFIIPFN